MLKALSIRDFTIVEQVDLEFAAGFNVITGETGAGKSILVDALGLLLGQRAEPGLVRAGQARAELSAQFGLEPGHPALAWLDEQAMAEDGEVLLRRVIPEDGASRAWINGRPATVAQLRELGEKLVEIHGQHEHQRLARPEPQRRWLDRHVEAASLEKVAETAAAWRALDEKLRELESEAGDEREQEFLEFQLRELKDLDLGEGEYEALGAEQKRLAGVDSLRAGMGGALAALAGDEPPGAAGQIGRALRSLEPLVEADESLGQLIEMLAEARVNLDEAISEINRRAGDLEDDPERLATVNRRLERALELARKHRVRAEELPRLAAELHARLERMRGFEAERAGLESERGSALEAWRAAAAELTRGRREAAAKLAEGIADALARLGMDQARVEFGVEPDPEARVNPEGQDRVELRFSANPGQPVQPLGRIASGGELSRVGLAMIIAAGERGGQRARVFDEIDAGVGGETAHAVGEFLRTAAGGGQAFCVTHLAQVAARADHQFRVAKHQKGDSTRVIVERLDSGERRREIARMLGSSRSDRGLAHAQELLEANRN